MSEIRNKEREEEHKFILDFWSFRKKFYVPEDNDEYWESLCNDANNLAVKYENNEYFNQLIVCCVNDIEGRYRKEKARRGSM